MQPWKISVGFTVIILAVAAMVGGEHFAYLEPHFQIIFTDYWMSLAWYGGLAIVTLLAVIYAAPALWAWLTSASRSISWSAPFGAAAAGKPSLPRSWDKKNGDSSPADKSTNKGDTQ